MSWGDPGVLYEYDLTIPKNTLASAPTELEVPLSAGTIVSVAVQFPTGCAGLVNVAILRSGHQVWPGDPDSAIKADGLTVSWQEDYDLDDPPFSLLLRGWSPGSRWPHTITFRFGIISLELARSLRGAPSLLERIGRLLRVR